MPPPLALSTAWNSRRHTDGASLLREIAELGFESVELSHGIRVPLVPGILKAVKDRVIRVSSVHAFCPLPPGVERASPNLFEPSTADESEFRLWQRYAEQTLDFASTLEARAVVLHLGGARRRWFDPSERLLTKALKVGLAHAAQDPKYLQARDEALVKLRQLSAEPWQRVLARLTPLASLAATRGLRLGLENREGVDELPLDADWPSLFTSANLPPACGYWHDSGHAQIKALLGLLDLNAHLAAMAPHVIGFHLHDCNADGHDHRPLGQGIVDFSRLSMLFRAEHLFTLELAPGTPADDVRASRERVQSLLAARQLV
jgi:sugar phosphate isomerase/epimerase